MISMDNIQTDPVYDGLFHRPGCSIQRTGKCICEYQAQWDEKEGC